MPTLFDPIQLGAIHAPNRILMAPLTRGRSTKDHVPTPLMGEYYAQRAGAGLILSEATGISRQGLGWAYAPGLWTEAQVEAWKPVVAAVHKAGGRFFAQLWHMGRIVHPDFLGGAKGVSASATTAPAKSGPMRVKSPMPRRGRWHSRRFPACWRITAARPRMRSPRASTACSSMPQTAT